MLFIFSIMTLCALAGLACVLLLSAAVIKGGLSGIPSYLFACLYGSLPICALLMTVLQMIFVLSGYIPVFGHISNHIVISFDILFAESILLMLLCNTTISCRSPFSKA